MPKSDYSGAIWDITIRRGCPLNLNATLQSGGVAMELDGEFTCQLRKTRASEDVAATVAIEIEDAEAGQVTIVMDQDEVEELTADRYVWDAVYTPTGGLPRAMWRGDVFVVNWVTHG